MGYFDALGQAANLELMNAGLIVGVRCIIPGGETRRYAVRFLSKNQSALLWLRTKSCLCSDSGIKQHPTVREQSLKESSGTVQGKRNQSL